MRYDFGSLFKKKCLRRTIFVSVPWFLQDISTYGIGIFTPTIMAAMALGGTHPSSRKIWARPKELRSSIFC